MSRIERRVERLGLQLPATPKPVAAYVPAIKTGDYVHTSGQLPILNGKMVATGLLGRDVTLEQGQEAARACVLNALAAIRSVIGDLEEITQIIRMTVYVASTPDFTDQPEVANGASLFLEKVFRDKGSHARSAVGCSSLPRNSPVEVELTVEILERGELDK